MNAVVRNLRTLLSLCTAFPLLSGVPLWARHDCRPIFAALNYASHLPYELKRAILKLRKDPHIENHEIVAIELNRHLSNQGLEVVTYPVRGPDGALLDYFVRIVPSSSDAARPSLRWLSRMSLNLQQKMDRLTPEFMIGFNTRDAILSTAAVQGVRLELPWESLISGRLTSLGGHEIKHLIDASTELYDKAQAKGILPAVELSLPDQKRQAYVQVHSGLSYKQAFRQIETGDLLYLHPHEVKAATPELLPPRKFSSAESQPRLWIESTGLDGFNKGAYSNHALEEITSAYPYSIRSAAHLFGRAITEFKKEPTAARLTELMEISESLLVQLKIYEALASRDLPDLENLLARPFINVTPTERDQERDQDRQITLPDGRKMYFESAQLRSHHPEAKSEQELVRAMLGSMYGRATQKRAAVKAEMEKIELGLRGLIEMKLETLGPGAPTDLTAIQSALEELNKLRDKPIWTLPTPALR